ncbi:MAG: Sua5/YciO/YrdC/YwlC family protein [Chitinispirillaceae bacterium]
MDNLKPKLQKGAILTVDTESGTHFCASAYSALGIARLFQRTGRKLSDPLIIYVHSRFDILSLSEEFPVEAYEVSSRFWPGELNIVLKSSPDVPEVLHDSSANITINMPSNPQFRELLKNAETPLASCQPSDGHSSADGTDEEISCKTEGFISSNPTTVSFVNPDRPVMIKEGAVKKNDIMAVIGELNESASDKRNSSFLRMHTRTPFLITNANSYSVSNKTGAGKVGLITFGPEMNHKGYTKIKTLSPAGDIAEAAANYHSTIKELDNLGMDTVILETLPESELGTQLNERFRKIGLDMQTLGNLMKDTCCE